MRRAAVGLVSAAVTAITQAAEALGARVLRCEQISARRTDVYRVSLSNDAPSGEEGDQLPAGLSVAAARIAPVAANAGGPVTDQRGGHRVVHGLAAGGVRVAAPLHPEPVPTPEGLVAFWEWLTPASPLSAAEWGRLTADLHTHGTHTARVLSDVAIGAYDPQPAFGPRLHLAHAHTERRGHRLHGQQLLLADFEAVLAAAIERARATAVGTESALVHGDNQPGNVLRTPAGTPVLADFERLAWGPVALDWSALLLGRWHYGFTAGHARDFHHGYRSLAPITDLEAILAQTEPFARVRELSGVLVAMIATGDSRWEREMYMRLPAISNPGFGNLWTFIGRHGDMRLTDTSRSSDRPEWKEVST